MLSPSVHLLSIYQPSSFTSFIHFTIVHLPPYSCLPLHIHSYIHLLYPLNNGVDPKALPQVQRPIGGDMVPSIMHFSLKEACLAGRGFEVYAFTHKHSDPLWISGPLSEHSVPLIYLHEMLQ